jgi:hypothetical protein
LSTPTVVLFTVVAVIVLLVPHHFKGGCWRL